MQAHLMVKLLNLGVFQMITGFVGENREEKTLPFWFLLPFDM